MAVLKPRNHTRLLLEARAKVWIAGQVLREHFDRDIAIHGRVVGFVDSRHTAGTKLIEQPVGAEVVSNQIAHSPPPHLSVQRSAVLILSCDPKTVQQGML